MDVEKRRAENKEQEDLTPVVCVWCESHSLPLIPLPIQTRGLVKGVMDRAHLLLRVTIAHHHHHGQYHHQYSDTTQVHGSHSHDDVITSPVATFARSMSVPPPAMEPSSIRYTEESCSGGRGACLYQTSMSYACYFLGGVAAGHCVEGSRHCWSFLRLPTSQTCWTRSSCSLAASLREQ